MERTTIEHWIGVITPAFPPMTTFSFRIEELGLTVEATVHEPEFPLPAEGRGRVVVLVFSRALIGAYEKAGDLARGAADGRLLAHVLSRLGASRLASSPRILARESERWRLTADELGLSSERDAA